MKTFNSFIQIKIFIIWIYCLSCISTIHGQTSCPNLVQNGDFESTGSFTSGLNPDCRCTANSYCVSNDFNNKCTQWPNFGDHTPTGTKFLIIDGSTGGAADVWRSTINVVPGTPYTFSFYIASFYARTSQIFDIGMIVNGQIEHQFTYSQATSTPSWVQISYSGITPAGVTSLSLAIRQMSGGAFRDFGIDDISFVSCPCDAYVGAVILTSCFNYQFFDNSFGIGPFSYSWNFGDPNSGIKNTSSLQNPSHQFSGCGFYNICLTITGPSGCKDTGCQIFNFVDTQKPTITCPPDLTISCNASTLPGNTGMALATDNCMNTFALGITYSDVTVIRPPCDRSIIRTWVATDVCRNSSSCIQTIILVDTTKPIIYCPQDRTIQCNVNNPPGLGLATATDNCTPTSNITLSSTDVLTGQAPCNLTITRTWTAEDACKNKAVCIQKVRMIDTIPPAISCPRNPTVNTNPGLCYFTGTYPSAVARDSCDSNPTLVCSLLTPISSILITLTTQYPKGVNTITCYAVDLCGNRSPNCTFTLTVVDKEAPKIDCPLSISVAGTFNSAGQCKAIVNNIAPIVSDNCPMTTVAYTLTGATTGQGIADASGTTFMFGTTTIQYIATDMAGNQDTCKFNVKVFCEDTCCDDNRNTITNGSFTSQPSGNLTPTSSPWYAANLTPQIGTGDSCETPRVGQMWGNSAVGEVMGQTTPFKSGWTYRISFCAKFININNRPPNLQHGWFNLEAENGAWTGNGAPIGQSPILNQHDVWTHVCLPDWTPSANYNRLFINFQNSSTTNHGDSVSWGRIDDICIQVIDSGCCEDSSQFATLVNQGFTIQKTNCKVTVTAPQFDTCYLFSTEPILDGAIVPQVVTNANGMWMYNFSQSGVHQVCVTVFDDCNTKQMCTRFEVKCDTCYCGTFSNLSARTSIGLANRIINCNDTIPLDCPSVFQFGGEFNCKGNDCDSTTKLDWKLDGPISTSGSMNIGTGFSLPLTASAFAASGLYTLTLTGYCDGQPCPPCKIYFNVTACDSSWSCPCDNMTSNIELVTNGHFSAGHDGSFTNDYIYFNPGTNTAIGGYSVVTNTQVPQANSQWACNDHTTGTGQFLIVDGASNTGNNVAWSQQIPGSDSGSFNLCFYVNNLVIPSKDYDDPIIGVFINGTQVIPNTTLPENPDVWVPFNATWVGKLPATIEIHTLSGNVVGNDFAIDDISFTKCSSTDCIEDFEDESIGTPGFWQVVNGSVSVVNTIPKIPPSQVLCGLDDDGGSWMFNTETKFTGDWIQKFGGNCFCFDIRYDNGNSANPLTGTSTLNIYSGASLTSGVRATFVVNNSLAIGNAWKRICVPIALSSGGVLPGNQFGQWTSNSNAAAFDILMQNVTGIAFVLDFVGGPNPSEKLYVDNFCIENCPPNNCVCGSFSNLFIRTGGAPNHPIDCGTTYTLNCPTAFQFGGEFACQGEGCDSTKVDWKITGPISGSGIVSANSGFTLPLNAQSFSVNGLYTLTLTGYCDGKPCPPCIIYFEVTGCSPCCKDSIAFSNAVANFQTNGALGNCIIFENGTGLDSCMQVTWSWGDNSTNITVGNATNVSHVYNSTGTYNVCYTIEEIDAFGKVCHSYKKCDSIYVICDTCECAGADHLSFGGHDFIEEATCNSEKIVDLPCDANGQPFYFHGNVNCAGDSCLEGKFEWVIKDTAGGMTTSGFGPIHIIKANTGHFDIIGLNAALFSPGVVYTITVTWYCGGEKCTCDIKFRFKDCDCKCGEFTNVFLRPTHSAPSIPVKCGGDAKQVACPAPGQPFNVAGQFHCEGNECPTNTQIDWMLLDPSGNKVDSGTFTSTPNWSLNLNNHNFGKAGTYTLMLTGHCGSKLCPCKIKFTFKEACPCDDCNCGKYSKMSIKPGNGIAKSVFCGDTATINCPGNGLNITLSGQMVCEGDSCPKTTTLDWILINPLGNPIASGNGVIVNPNFTISVSSSLLTSSGVYTLQLIGNCGSQRCTCEVKIKMDKPCPDKCECDGFTILAAISRGPIKNYNCGDSIYISENLKLFFDAQLNCKGICPPASSIIITLIDPKGKLVPVTSIDENSFPIPGTYTLELTGYCGNKVCKCKIYFINSTDCCKDEQIFEQDVLNNISISTDPVTCKVTLNTGNLSECSCISKISWGDGSQTFGPIMVGGMSMHTYTANGTYILSYIVSETDPATGEYCNVNVFKDTVKIQCGPKLGFEPITRNDFDTKIRVFPNPNTGSFIVDLISPALPGTKLKVVGLTGQVLAEKIADLHKSTQTMNVQTLPSGLYFIQILVEGKLIKVEKFIKQ